MFETPSEDLLELLLIGDGQQLFAIGFKSVIRHPVSFDEGQNQLGEASDGRADFPDVEREQSPHYAENPGGSSDDRTTCNWGFIGGL